MSNSFPQGDGVGWGNFWKRLGFSGQVNSNRLNLNHCLREMEPLCLTCLPIGGSRLGRIQTYTLHLLGVKLYLHTYTHTHTVHVQAPACSHLFLASALSLTDTKSQEEGSQVIHTEHALPP